MDTLSVSPHRSLVFPFVVLLYPLLYFIGGETGLISPYESVSETPIRILALIMGAVVVSCVFSIVLVAALGVRTGTVTGWEHLLFRPSERVMGIFLLIALIPPAYFFAGLVVDLPPWTELAIGIPFAWPAFVVLIGMYAVENAGLTLPYLAQILIIGLGISLSVAWMFLLANWFATGTLPTRSVVGTR